VAAEESLAPETGAATAEGMAPQAIPAAARNPTTSARSGYLVVVTRRVA